jgi:toxin ParE1/3/4
MPSPFQLTEDAVRDLERTMDHLSQHSLAAASALADELEEAFLFLTQWPNAGKRMPEHHDDPVRFWPVARHTIAYLPESQPLLILAVIHGSRDAFAEIDFRLHRR